MTNDPFVPAPSSPGQPEKTGHAAPGHDWNNSITRRNFLRRTGGATVATVAVWHGMTNQSFATGPHQGYPVVIKVTITIPAGSTWKASNDPLAAPADWKAEEEGEMGSGDTLTAWSRTSGDGTPIVEVNGNINGPKVIVYTRTVIEG